MNCIRCCTNLFRNQMYCVENPKFCLDCYHKVVNQSRSPLTDLKYCARCPNLISINFNICRYCWEKERREKYEKNISKNTKKKNSIEDYFKSN